MKNNDQRRVGDGGGDDGGDGDNGGGQNVKVRVKNDTKTYLHVFASG